MAWSIPITDRTQSDVDYALENQSSASDLKGAWNISDINRVIDNSIYLRDILISYGYDISFTDQTHLTEADIPYITSVIKVLKDNVKALVDGFYSSGNPTISYSALPNYTMANDLETNLVITKTLIENMIEEFVYCGTFYCGEDLILV